MCTLNPGPSSPHHKQSEKVLEDEDSIQLLDESEALELVGYDPNIEPKNIWDPPSSMVCFLETHFNRTLEESEREAILKDFLKPHCKAIMASRLDEQVKDQAL